MSLKNELKRGWKIILATIIILIGVVAVIGVILLVS